MKDFAERPVVRAPDVARRAAMAGRDTLVVIGTRESADTAAAILMQE